MPAGVLVTVPLPLPALLTLSVYSFCVKVAVTDWLPSMVMLVG